MEAIAVTVPDQNVSGVGDVDPVGEARDFLAADATLELASFAEDGNAMTLEVADVEIISCEIYNSLNCLQRQNLQFTHH